MGSHVGQRIVDIHYVRDRSFKRETRLINVLLFVKTTVWKSLFGKEADKLEQATDSETTYYLIENEPLVNRFVSVPKDKGSLNCASFVAGVIESVLTEMDFPAKVTIPLVQSVDKGVKQPTYFMIKFDESVITREKSLESK
jgi:hypothetical protein